MEVYEKNIPIPHFDGDDKGELKVENIIKYFGEASIVHNEFSANIDKLEEDNCGWMIRNWKVTIDKYPKVNDEIRIKTWISKIDMFFVNREFIIYDGEDIPIIRGTAVWIFMDMKRKRPVRVTNDYVNTDHIIDKYNFKDFTRYGRDLDLEGIKDFHVRKSDIDTNGHVNNLIYFIWMLESIPSNVYDECRLEELEIEYKMEVLYPSIISSEHKMKEEEGSYIFTHGIIQEGNDEYNAFGRTKWRKGP